MDFARKIKFAKDAATGSCSLIVLLPVHAASYFFGFLCAGMLYLHSSNPVILHRDLKSDNLLVTQDWTVKVADFGLTRFLSEKKAMTQVGTPMWMAPEIIMGRKYTEKGNSFSL